MQMHTVFCVWSNFEFFNNYTFLNNFIKWIGMIRLRIGNDQSAWFPKESIQVGISEAKIVID